MTPNMKNYYKLTRDWVLHAEKRDRETLLKGGVIWVDSDKLRYDI